MDLGVFGIGLSLVLLMYLAYRGISVIILAPVLACFAAVMSGEYPAIVAYTEIFMKGISSFVMKYFPVFLTGAIFGKLMGVSGASKTISHFFAEKLGKERAILAVVLATALLVYGGVSLFVVVFAIYPIGSSLYREADIPKRLLPASIALGAFTFAMTALPGTPQYINTMPIKYFNTNIYAAPIIGLVGSAIMLSLGIYWLNYRAKSLKAAGEGYGEHKENFDEHQEKLPSFTISMIPILVIFVLNYYFTNFYFKSFGSRYTNAMDSLGSNGINGIWPVIISLLAAIIVCMILFRGYIKDLKKEMADGAVGSLLPIMNTGSEVGYGAVIKALGSFMLIKEGILSVPGSPLVKVAVSTTAMAGMVGSSSGGTAIALGALGETFANLASVTGVSPQAMHRISIMAAGGLDTFPHSGAVITLLAVCGLTHKESYKDVAVCTMAIPLVATAVGIVLGSFGIV